MGLEDLHNHPSASSSSNSSIKRRSDSQNCETKNEETKTPAENPNNNECRTLSIFSLSGFIRLISVPIKYFCKNIIDLIKFTWSLLGFNQPREYYLEQDL